MFHTIVCHTHGTCVKYFTFLSWGFQSIYCLSHNQLAAFWFTFLNSPCLLQPDWWHQLFSWRQEFHISVKYFTSFYDAHSSFQLFMLFHSMLVHLNELVNCTSDMCFVPLLAYCKQGHMQRGAQGSHTAYEVPPVPLCIVVPTEASYCSLLM